MGATGLLGLVVLVVVVLWWRDFKERWAPPKSDMQREREKQAKKKR